MDETGIVYQLETIVDEISERTVIRTFPYNESANGIHFNENALRERNGSPFVMVIKALRWYNLLKQSLKK